jgi:hypothetical protein
MARAACNLALGRACLNILKAQRRRRRDRDRDRAGGGRYGLLAHSLTHLHTYTHTCLHTLAANSDCQLLLLVFPLFLVLYNHSATHSRTHASQQVVSLH